MPSKPLTSAAVERLKPPARGRRERFDGRLPGFGVRVTDNGKKSWIVLYTHAGRRRRYTIGPADQIPLAEAREAAREVQKAVREGRDPAAERAAAGRGAADERTFAAAVDAYIKQHVARFTPRGQAEARRPLERLKVAWGERALEDITRADLIEAREHRVQAGQLPTAERELKVLRRFFRWCVDGGRLEASPAAMIASPLDRRAPRSRDRVLRDRELALLWRAMERLEYPFAPFFKLLTLTGQRRSEVAGMAWPEVDLPGALWTIPAARTKARREQDVPLSAAALEVLAGVPRFAGGCILSTRGGDVPVSGFSKAKARLEAIAAEIAAAEGLEPPAGWRPHDLRRTFASGLARLGVKPHIIAAALNHSAGSMQGITAVYNRYEYLPEKRAAMEAWAGHVRAATAAQRGGNVVALHGA